MIRITLYQNTNEANSQSYQKWYPRPVADETYNLDTLARHMASHNSPYSPCAGTSGRTRYNHTLESLH